MFDTNVALLDIVIDLIVHIGQAALEQARVPIMLDAKCLYLLPLHELELLELITLHLLLAQDVLDLTNLFMQRLNVSLFGHEGLAQITDSLFVQLERIVLREQLIVDGVDEVFGAHLLSFSFLVVLLQFTNHAA